ncbi:MAG: hypothetical protein WCJ35_25440 [Planctomycetota bacterium]
MTTVGMLMIGYKTPAEIDANTQIAGPPMQDRPGDSILAREIGMPSGMSLAALLS